MTAHPVSRKYWFCTGSVLMYWFFVLEIAGTYSVINGHTVWTTCCLRDRKKRIAKETSCNVNMCHSVRKCNECFILLWISKLLLYFRTLGVPGTRYSSVILRIGIVCCWSRITLHYCSALLPVQPSVVAKRDTRHLSMSTLTSTADCCAYRSNSSADNVRIVFVQHMFFMRAQ